MSDTHKQQLDIVRSEWRAISRRRESREAAAILQSRLTGTANPPFDDLGEVVALLEPGGGLDQIGRARLVADLLEACPAHPLLARALLQTLLPGIVAVARRLRWGDRSTDDPATFLGDLITVTFEVIAEWSGQRRPYAAPDILNAVRCRMRRRLDLEASDAIPLEHPDGSTLELRAVETPDRLCSLAEEVLAVARNDSLGAAALLGREIYGWSYSELATMTGATPRQVAAAGRALARRISGGEDVLCSDASDDR